MKIKPAYLIFFVFVVFVIILFFWLSQVEWGRIPESIGGLNDLQSDIESTGQAQLFDSVVIIDGDTIDLNGQRVRYIGIDTPELGRDGEKSDCYAREAADYNRNLAISGKLRMEKDLSETDKYNRLLRYVYLDDGRMINEVLVAEGYAKVATYPPDVKYAERFKELERQAKQSGKGLWSGCVGANKKGF